MVSELIQFRLSGQELEALKAIAREGESLNLTAQRLVKEVLSVSTNPYTAPSIPTLEERLEQMVEAKLSTPAIPDLDERLDEIVAAKLSTQNDILTRLQERIQEVERQLGEYAA